MKNELIQRKNKIMNIKIIEIFYIIHKIILHKKIKIYLLIQINYLMI